MGFVFSEQARRPQSRTAGPSKATLSSHFNSGTHGCADSDSFDVLSFDRDGFHAGDEVDKDLNVLGKFVGVETQLADHGMHDTTGIVAELDLAGVARTS